MSLTQTTAAGNIAAGDTRVKLTAFTNPSTGPLSTTYLRVDGEYMQVTDTTTSPTLSVVRGALGSLAQAHNKSASIAYGLSTDFTQGNHPVASVAGGQTITSYGANGAISIPTTASNLENLVFLNQTAALAMTLAAPPVDQDGLLLVITSNTTGAHTIAATSLFNQGGGSVASTATYAAHAGASTTLQASRGLWNVISANNVTYA